jgi:hypothetical protein
VARNRNDNVVVVPAAASSAAGTAKFATALHPAMGQLSSLGELEVDTITIDELARRHRPPDVIKMDVEGGELRALQGAVRTLHVARPVIFLATHGAEVHDACVELLERAGYGLESLVEAEDRGELVARPSEASSGS